jgi:cell division septation protein DedD
VLLGGAGLYTAWRHSGQLERIEARLGAPETVGEPTPKGASGAESLAQTASLRSLREELSTLSDQLRTQAAEDRHNLQMALRELGPLFEQRRKAPEAAVDETTRSGDPPATRGAPRAAPPQTAAAPKSNDVTKPPPGKPSAGPSTGPWAIAVGSFTDPAAATQEVERLRGLGVTAEVQAVQTESKTWHRVSVAGFPSREAAQAYASSAKANPRLARVFADYWIGKR